MVIQLVRIVKGITFDWYTNLKHEFVNSEGK